MKFTFNLNKKEFNMSKIKIFSLTVCLAFALVSAQPSTSISGSAGYYRAVVDGLEDYPFNGAGFQAGISGLIPMTDIARFGIGAYVGYSSVSATDEYDAELAISALYLGLEPKLRLGQEKTYADISLQIAIPLSNKATMKVPGYGSVDLDVEDAETSFAVGLFGRYDVIGVGIAKTLNGSNGATTLAASILIPLSEQFEMGPSINYAMGKDETDLIISLGFEYTF